MERFLYEALVALEIAGATQDAVREMAVKAKQAGASPAEVDALLEAERRTGITVEARTASVRYLFREALRRGLEARHG